MSTVLYELPDRYVLDTGEVVGRHVKAVRAILAGQPLDGCLFVDSDDLQRFARASGQTPRGWTDDQIEGQPDPATHGWNLPPEYQKIVLHDHINELLIIYLTENPPGSAEQVTAYTNRLTDEFRMIEERNMTDFVRSLIYLIDVFRKNNVVWGVGRGSSVESLVLFLIGVHMVDPVLYEIPPAHFFRG